MSTTAKRPAVSALEDVAQVIASSKTLSEAHGNIWAAAQYLYLAGHFEAGNKLIESSAGLLKPEDVQFITLETRRGCEYAWAASGSRPAVPAFSWANLEEGGPQYTDEAAWSDQDLEKAELRQRELATKDNALEEPKDITDNSWDAQSDSHVLLAAAFRRLRLSNGAFPTEADAAPGLAALEVFIQKFKQYRPSWPAALLLGVEASARAEKDTAFALAAKHLRHTTALPQNRDRVLRADPAVLLGCRHFVLAVQAAAGSVDSPFRVRLDEFRKALGVVEDEDGVARAVEAVNGALKVRVGGSGPASAYQALSLREVVNTLAAKACKAHKVEYEHVKITDPDDVLRPAATDADIAAAEKRLGYSLPDDYKKFVKIADGWKGWGKDTPSLSSIGSVALRTYWIPLRTTHGLDGAYDTDATADTFISLYNPASGNLEEHDAARRVFLVRDHDLPLAHDRPPPAKKAKTAPTTADGDAQSKDFTRGKYRIMEVPGVGCPPVYFESVREWVESVLGRVEREARWMERMKSAGVEVDTMELDLASDDEAPKKIPVPQPSAPVYVPTHLFGMPFGAPLAAPNVAAVSTTSMLLPTLQAPAAAPAPSGPLPNCWYGNECRTKNHNASHAARFNHNCPNTRKT